MKQDIKNLFTVVTLTKELARNHASALMVEAERGLSLRDTRLMLRTGAALSQAAGDGASRAAGMFYTARALMSLPAHRVRGVALLLEVAGESSGIYRAKACLALGNFYVEEGEYELARRFYHDAERLADQNLVVTFLARKNEAQSYSETAAHDHARARLESLNNLAKAVAGYRPVYFYEYLNSLALELNATGAREPALKLARIVSASPFARFYPEWSQTYREIEGEPRKSQITITRLRQKADPYDPARVEQMLRIQRVALDEYLTTAEARAYANAGERALKRRGGIKEVAP